MKKSAPQPKPQPAREPSAALRQRAEQRLRAQSNKTSPTPAYFEKDRQQHELEVHQIELEMQNAELLAARFQLEAALDKYTDLYEFAPVGYLTLDPQGLILGSNLTGASLLGIVRASLVNRDFRQLLAAAERPAFDTFLKTVFSSKVTQSCEVTLELAGRPPLILLLEAAAFTSVSTCRVMVMDVTQKKHAEMDRVILNKLESTGILAGGIAHDFNNLFTVILMNLELALLLEPDELMARHLKEARETSLLARGLTAQLVTFADGGLAVRRLAMITKLIQDSVRPALSGSNVRAEFTLAEALWPTEVDEGQIGQVVRNLVLNAREAMPEGGVVLVRSKNVRLGAGEQTTLPPGEYVQVSITDHGSGIAKDVLPKIFDPYFSTKMRGSQKGMGLGLTICHTIVQKHGGALAVESTLGTGTTFHLYLPAAAPLAVPAPAAPPAARLRPQKILLMDDDPSLRNILSEMLERMGHEVAGAAEGQSAVKMYQRAMKAKQPFDLVILDLMVAGGMGGQAAVQALRQIDRNVNAIVMSGYATEPVMLEPGRHGFSEALAKPFDHEKLQEILARVTAP